MYIAIGSKTRAKEGLGVVVESIIPIPRIHQLLEETVIHFRFDLDLFLLSVGTLLLGIRSSLLLGGLLLCGVGTLLCGVGTLLLGVRTFNLGEVTIICLHGLIGDALGDPLVAQSHFQFCLGCLLLIQSVLELLLGVISVLEVSSKCSDDLLLAVHALFEELLALTFACQIGSQIGSYLGVGLLLQSAVLCPETSEGMLGHLASFSSYVSRDGLGQIGAMVEQNDEKQ
ncbi:hypothetical protein PG985_003717 [Apiospora marii]|uniref:Uncharacterized protein n=1 Tax=Apiospora marii TaxID=335849 RepID=A0ABR1SJ06_9PEZI